MSDEHGHPTKDGHEVTYTHSGDPRASGVPTTGVPTNPVPPAGKVADTIRHPNNGRFTGKGK